MFWKVPTPSTSYQGPEDVFTCWPDQVDRIEEFFFFFCYFLSWWVYGVRDINMENSLRITEQKIIFSWGGKKMFPGHGCMVNLSWLTWKPVP